MTALPLSDEPPWVDGLTPYDEAHFSLYMALLEAEAARAPDAEVCQAYLAIDANRDPERAYRRLESHLRRARWFSTGDGFRHLVNRDVRAGDPSFAGRP